MECWSNGVSDCCAGWKSLVFFLPTFATLADKVRGLVLRIDRQQVAKAELVPGGILQRLLIQTLRGREIRKRVQHGEKDGVAPRIVRAPKHHQRHVVPVYDAGDACPARGNHVLGVLAGVRLISGVLEFGDMIEGLREAKGERNA